MKSFMTSLLSKSGEISSKRLWGSIILLMLCFAYVWCTMNQVEMVGDTDAFLTLAGVLLGIEAVVSPFAKTKKEPEEDIPEQ